MDGKCVRLIRGERRSVINYEKNPLELAEEYCKYCTLVHVIDLDGAFTGEMKNIGIITELAKKFPIQVGGGVRSEEKIRELLGIGVKRVIVSTMLFKDPENARKLKKKYYGKLIGSFDFKQGKLSYAGWTEQSLRTLEEVSGGLAEIIVTDIERDGTLEGPNLELLKKIKEEYNGKITAAGGVRDMMDILDLKKMGMDGVIIGKAFLENKIDPWNGFKFENLSGE